MKIILSCSSCAFFEQVSNKWDDSVPEMEKVDGECHRWPRKKENTNNSFGWDKFPEIKDMYDCWCGEYKPRFEVKRTFSMRDFMYNCIEQKEGFYVTKSEFESECSRYMLSSESIIKKFNLKFDEDNKIKGWALKN